MRATTFREWFSIWLDFERALGPWSDAYELLPHDHDMVPLRLRRATDPSHGPLVAMVQSLGVPHHFIVTISDVRVQDLCNESYIGYHFPMVCVSWDDLRNALVRISTQTFRSTRSLTLEEKWTTLKRESSEMAQRCHDVVHGFTSDLA
jgi:hypothetical protein